MNFEEIYHEYGGKILNLAFRMTGKEEVARDLTQDIFIKVYQNLSSFREQSQIYTWIYRIALNHILNYLKKERRFQWQELMDKKISEFLSDDKLETQFRLHANPVSPDEKLESDEREKIVWTVILKLPPKLRVPFVLNRYEDLSYQEIAEKLDISLSNVESRIHRAKKAVMKNLEPWLDKI